MNKLIITSLIFFSSLSFASSNCFWKGAVSGFQTSSSTEMTIIAGSEYKLTFDYFCHELTFASEISFKTWPSNSSRVCKGDDLLILDPFDHHIIQRCRIHSVEKIDKE